MHAYLAPYSPMVHALLTTAALFIVQLLMLDFAGIKAKHSPGMPMKADHASFLFRASRAHGNTNESSECLGAG